MFLEYFDVTRPDWPPETLAAILTRLQESGYQGLSYDVQQMLARYAQPHAARALDAALAHVVPFTDVLIPPAQPRARLIVHRPAPGVLRFAVVGRSQHEAHICTTAVKMHLEAALGSRISDVMSDENGRASLSRFRRDVLPALRLVGEDRQAFEFRNPGTAQLLMALRHQPAFRGRPTVLSSQVAALAPDRPAEQTREGLDQLAADGALERWHVVICKEGGQWLAVSPNAEEIKAFVASNVTCPHCGKRVTEEQPDVIYRMGDTVQAYLVDNRWMCDLVETALRRLGVEAVSVQPGAGPVDGAACYHGAVLLFRVKDGGATAADGAPLREEARRLEGEGWRAFPILVSEQPSSDGPHNGITVVDGLAALDATLEGVLLAARQANLETLLPPLLHPVAIPLADLLPTD